MFVTTYNRQTIAAHPTLINIAAKHSAAPVNGAPARELPDKLIGHLIALPGLQTANSQITISVQRRDAYHLEMREMHYQPPEGRFLKALGQIAALFAYNVPTHEAIWRSMALRAADSVPSAAIPPIVPEPPRPATNQGAAGALAGAAAANAEPSLSGLGDRNFVFAVGHFFCWFRSGAIDH